MTKAERFRELLKRDGPVMCAGVYDAISAKIAEAVGFEMVGSTGYCIHGAMLGTPDVGLVSYSEMLSQVEHIANAVEIPLFADGESGYGSAINLMREVREMEARGAAGIFFDDQQIPPNCPWVKDMSVISMEEMVGKIRAAVAARKDPNFVLVARSDAMNFEEQVERVNAYYEAGADLVMISHMHKEDVPRAPGLVKGPMALTCSTGRGGTVHWNAFELGDMGYKVVRFIQAALFLNIKNTMDGLRKIRETGWQQPIMDQAISMEDYFKLVGKDHYLELQERFIHR